MDLQFRARDIVGRLARRLGPGLSQVHFDNDSGRYVVSISPAGNESQARRALAELGLQGTQVRRSRLGFVERGELVETLTRRLADVIESGHAKLADLATGVQITVTRGASAEEQARVHDAARDAGVRVADSEEESFDRMRPIGCNGSFVDGAGIPARFCDLLRGGSRFFTGPNYAIRCTLGWWGGLSDGSDPSYFLTAGHCIGASEAPWRSCTTGGVTAASCPIAGRELGQRYTSGSGDNGLLYVGNAGWWREAGATDWRNGARMGINRYIYNVAYGDTFCYSGATSGYGCGIVSHGAGTFTTPSGHTIRSLYVAEGMCGQPGDSGGPVFTGSDGSGALGVIVAGPERGCTPSSTSLIEPIERMIETYGVWPYGW